jgi:ribosome-associated toxin RatA of RatAB toxin-antitoxin module
MRRLTRSVLVDRSPADVFALISDADRAREFFVGITRWEPRSRRRRGVGARYRVLTRVGSIQAGSTLVVTEWEPGRLLAWTSEAGIEQRGRWVLEAKSAGTELTLEVEYDLPGGPVGALVERLAGRVIGRDMTATLLAARRILEFEERRKPATRRRPAPARKPSKSSSKAKSSSKSKSSSKATSGRKAASKRTSTSSRAGSRATPARSG